MYNAVWDGFEMADKWLILGEPATILVFIPRTSSHGFHYQEEEEVQKLPFCN